MIPKHVGRDCELSTSGLDPHGRGIPSWEVTRHVLGHIGAALEPEGGTIWTPGVRSSGHDDDGRWSSDTLRKWTSAGQCFYADMSHCEACTAETKHPRLVAAQSLSLLEVLEAARQRAQADAEPGTRYALTTANVDLVDPGVSWGTHLNVTVESDLWEDLVGDVQRPSRLTFVASALAALIPFFGAGYLFPSRSGPLFSLSGRAHHLTRISTHPTTEAYGRGLLNSRREPHGSGMDRLHLIGFDFALASTALLTCTLQCCLAAAEAGLDQAGLALTRPVEAMLTWSHGVDVERGRLAGHAELTGGGRISLPAYMRRLVTFLLDRCRDGSIPEGIAPEASGLLSRVVELTHYLDEGGLSRAAQHLDWAAKLLVLLDLCEADGLELAAPRIRIADHDYASTDRERGHFWRLWDDGLVDPLTSRAVVAAARRDGPEDGRGWARGRLIRSFHQSITAVDWDFVELRNNALTWAPRVRIDLPHPWSGHRTSFEPAMDVAPDIEAMRQLFERPGSSLDEPEGVAGDAALNLRVDEGASTRAPRALLANPEHRGPDNGQEPDPPSRSA
jgi:hypothetical protein